MRTRFADNKAERCEEQLRDLEQKLTKELALMNRYEEGSWEYEQHQKEARKLSHKQCKLEKELEELEAYAY